MTANPDFPDYQVENIFDNLIGVEKGLIGFFVLAFFITIINQIQFTDILNIKNVNIFSLNLNSNVYQSLIEVNGILLGASLIAVFYTFERFGSAFKNTISITRDLHYSLQEIDWIYNDPNIDSNFRNETKWIKRRIQDHLKFLESNKQKNNDRFIFCFILIIACFMLAIAFLLIPLHSERNGAVSVIFSISYSFFGLLVLYLIWKTFDNIDMINETEEKFQKDYFRRLERCKSKHDANISG